MSIKDRIRRLEGRDGPGCQECRDKPVAIQAYYPDEGEHAPERECCPECGRSLGVVIRVVYDG